MTWDGLDEKERSLDGIKGYVEVNEDVERESMRYIGEVWTELCKCVTPSLKENEMCPVIKDYNT